MKPSKELSWAKLPSVANYLIMQISARDGFGLNKKNIEKIKQLSLIFWVIFESFEREYIFLKTLRLNAQSYVMG